MLGWLSWWPFARYSHWDASRNGKADGRRSIPESNQELQPSYIMEIKQFGEENIKRLAQDWKKQDTRLLADYCATKQSSETLSEQLNKAEDEVREARGDEENAREEYVKHFHLTSFWYWVLLLAIAVVEVPLNTVVFQLFGEKELFTIMTALGLAIVLPVCAHFVGGMLKQGFLKDGKFTTHTLGIILLNVAAIGSLAGVAYIREKYFEGSGVQQLLGVSIDFTTITVIFFMINLLIYLVAAVGSYIAHDPLATKYRLELRAAKNLLKNAKNKVNLLEQRKQQTQERLHSIAAMREKSFESTQHEAKEICDIAQKLMSHYHTHNMRQRSSPSMPECFKKYPPIDIPEDINPEAQLTWGCKGVLQEKEARKQINLPLRDLKNIGVEEMPGNESYGEIPQVSAGIGVEALER